MGNGRKIKVTVFLGDTKQRWTTLLLLPASLRNPAANSCKQHQIFKKRGFDFCLFFQHWLDLSYHLTVCVFFSFYNFNFWMWGCCVFTAQVVKFNPVLSMRDIASWFSLDWGLNNGFAFCNKSDGSTLTALKVSFSFFFFFWVIGLF